MGERSDINKTLDETEFGTSLKDLESGDLTRGWHDGAPEGNYEGSLDGDTDMMFGGGSAGTLHAGHIEPDGFHRTHHGEVPDEYGFVRRPRRGGDVERN